nr:hypothetical protein [Tanacetum cinerariifolium]
MPIDDWSRHIDFFLRPDQTKKSETNSKNRSKQPYLSVQGKSNPHEYPSLVSNFGINHTSKATGTYVNEAATTKHKELQDALKSGQESKTYTQDEVNDLFKTEGKKLRKSLGKKIAKKIYSSFNKKLENMMTQLAEKGMSLDKTPVVGDDEYKESDDEEIEVLDEDENENEDEEINDGDASVE